MEMMMVVKGLPSTYNKDLQADKRPLREGVEEPIRVLMVFGASIGRIRPRLPGEGGPAINPAILATDLVDYLVERKVSFREAHGIVGEAVAWAESKKRALDTLDGCRMAEILAGVRRRGGGGFRSAALGREEDEQQARPTRTWSGARSNGPKASSNRG